MSYMQRVAGYRHALAIAILCVLVALASAPSTAHADDAFGSVECSYANGLPFLLFGLVQDHSPIWTCTAFASYKNLSVLAIDTFEAQIPSASNPYDSGEFDDVLLTGSIPFGQSKHNSTTLNISIEHFRLREIPERQYPAFPAWAPQAFLMKGPITGNNIGIGFQAFLPTDSQGVGREFLAWTEGNLKLPVSILQIGLRGGLVASDVSDGVDYFPRVTGYGDLSLEATLTPWLVFTSHAMSFIDHRQGNTSTGKVIFSGGIRLQI